MRRGHENKFYQGGATLPQCNTDMANNFISIRVLQHDKSDQIRIGAERGIFQDQLDRAVQDVIAQYEQNTEWCGGFKAACESYYKRIAIVNGETLEIIRMIHPVKEEE